MELLQGLEAAKGELMPTLTSFGTEDQLEMLSKFARSGRCVEIRSHVLDEKILIAADNAELPDVELVAYGAAELAGMVGQSPDELRAIHAVRKAFDGEVLENGHDGNSTREEVRLIVN